LMLPNFSLIEKAKAAELKKMTQFVMIQTVSRMRIISENCGINFDEKYSEDLIEVLSGLNVDVGEARRNIDLNYKADKFRFGDECKKDSLKALKFFNDYYKNTIKEMRALIK
ncbi:hypothetical protein GR156_22810, partial [Shinella zoogloeoides]